MYTVDGIRRAVRIGYVQRTGMGNWRGWPRARWRLGVMDMDMDVERRRQPGMIRGAGEWTWPSLVQSECTIDT